jgi:hypothetical protein
MSGYQETAFGRSFLFENQQPMAVTKFQKEIDLSALSVFFAGVSSVVATDRKDLFIKPSNARDPIKINCAAQIQTSTLTARNAKSIVPMIGLRSNVPLHRPCQSLS